MPEISGDVWSALLGAVVGAAAGGVVTWLLQLDAQRHQKADQASNKLEVQQALAYAILYKLVSIGSHYSMYRSHFDRGFDAANPGEEPWQFILAMGDEPDPVHFTTDEMTLLVSLGMQEAFNSLLTLDDAHNQMIRLSAFYRIRREALTSLMTPAAFVGAVGASVLTPAEVGRVRPLMIELNSLATSMRAFAKRDAEESSSVLDMANRQFREKLKIRVDMVPKTDRPSA